jgi:DNA-directed DNA polymerase III PolC
MYLNTHTYFSLRYGTMKPEELLAMGQQMGVTQMALTDINNTSACLDFVRLAPDYQIKPVLGIDFRNGVEQQFVAIAKNNAGFQELNTYLSPLLHSKEAIPHRAPRFKQAFVIYPFEKPPLKLRKNEFLGVRARDVHRLRLSPWLHKQHKLVIMQPATFRHKRDFNAHRLLRAIDNNTLLSKLSKAEEAHEADKIMPIADLLVVFESFPQMIENTNKLLAKCTIQFEFGVEHPHKNQQTYTGSQEKDFRLVKKLCQDGLLYRYQKPTQKISDRIDKELGIIKQKGFLSYFLINWDIVSYARSRGFFYVGRGSGANSVVAYLLRITDVDPIDLDLYFERFINLYRKNPPDFDIDFSWKDRDEVTAYIFNRFKHVSLLATYSTFQYKAVVRELGKVFGLPAHEIARLSGGRTDFVKLDQLAKLILQYGSWIKGFPSHLSVHAGGVLITEKTMHYFTATSLPPKGFPITHFDMVVAEDAGIYKFDILSQRGLSKIKEALAVIRRNRPAEPFIDIHDVDRFKKDELVKSILRQGKAIGCFYVESPAMRMLLKKLEVDTYVGLVAASSIIRPGVAKSGMMREYIYRFRNPNTVKERAYPVLLDIMPDTFGVMVYQEDVIKVAHYFAGLTLAEADYLRRGMSGKFRSRTEFHKTKDKFFSNCRAKGVPEADTKEVWRQIESFAGYAFSKGHSASYAVESFQSLFLKAHYPLEYMVAVINNFGGFYRTETYVHEARMHGATIEAPCVNKSESMTSIEGKTIYLGLNFISELAHKTIEEMLLSRESQGPFKSIDDLVQRVSISLEQVKLLIKAGAFRFTGKNKKALMWEAHFLLGNSGKSIITANLFYTPPQHFTLPVLEIAKHEDSFDQIELLGFPLCSPFSILRALPIDCITTADMPKYLGKMVDILGYYVHKKNAITSNKKEMMHFGTFLDINGFFLDSVHFPVIAKKYPFRGRGIYRLRGKVVEEFGYYSLEAQKMEILPLIEDPRYQ